MLTTLEMPFPQAGGCTERKVSAPHFWKGGASGAEHDWLLPANWYNNRVPSWFDKVVIPYDPNGGGHYPNIGQFVSDIAQLVIEPGARLVVSRQGRLTVDGLGKRGIGILNEGELIVEGELTICRTTSSNVRNRGLIRNEGSIAFDLPLGWGMGRLEGGRIEGLGEILWFG